MEKTVIVIGAVSQDGVYGVGNKIPWRIPSEIKHFKEQTMGHTVVMGRGTWESLPPKFRPLPDRANMVITNTPQHGVEGAEVFKSIEQAIDAAATEKVFLIGGHDIWYHGMSLADEALITIVFKDFWTNDPDERMAPELLKVEEKWRHLVWSSSEGSLFGGEETPYEIHHYTRSVGGAIRTPPSPSSHPE